MDFIISLAGRTGRIFLKYIDYILSLSGLLYTTIKTYVTRDYMGKSLVRMMTIEQIYFTAVRSFWLVIIIAVFLGTLYFLRLSSLGSEQEISKMVLMVLTREVGPILIGILAILRSATAVTTEVAYMNVRKEIDAIQMSGVDPVALICIPRLVGITTGIVCLIIIFDITAVLGGYIIAESLSLTPLSNFAAMVGKSLAVSDVIAGLIKGVCFAFIITSVCIYRGFEAKNSITEIPAKVSRSSVECFFYCLLINIIISIFFSLQG